MYVIRYLSVQYVQSIGICLLIDAIKAAHLRLDPFNTLSDMISINFYNHFDREALLKISVSQIHFS
jgi:hypothetical protein